MNEDYEVYAGAADQDDLPWELRDDVSARRETGGWQVAVEYWNNAERGPATTVVVRGEVYDDRDRALAAAEQEAFEFDPPDPWSPQSRTVYQDGPDGFIAFIEGAVSTYHMSVRVLRLLVPNDSPH